MGLARSKKLLLLGHFLGEIMASRYYVEAGSPPGGTLANPPSGSGSGSANHHGHRPIWGGFAIGILTVLVGASLYYLFRRKLIPVLRSKSQRKGKGECTILMNAICFVDEKAFTSCNVSVSQPTQVSSMKKIRMHLVMDYNNFKSICLHENKNDNVCMIYIYIYS